MHFVVQWVKKMIFWKNGFWQREQRSLGICSCAQAYLNYLRYSYLLDRSQYPGITFYNEVPVSTWLYFLLFSGVERQCRISRGKRLICYLMQLNSICQAILFTSSWRDWGIWERMGGSKCIPRSGFKGRNRHVRAWFQDSPISCKSSGGTLLHLSYNSLKFFSFTYVWKGIFMSFEHFYLIKRY